MMVRHFAFPLLAALIVNPVSRAEDPPPKPITVPFELLRSKHMLLSVKLNGKGPYRILFDTGAPLNVIGTRAAKESGLLDPTQPAPLPFFGMQKPIPAKQLQIGDLQIKSLPVLVMDHPALAVLSQAFGPVDGILGFPFFARYRMTLDYQSQQLTFVPNGYQPADVLQALMAALLVADKPEPKVVAPAGLWGCQVEKDAKDEAAGVVIKDVLPGSPAAAGGLKAGDRLLTLDGRWTDSVADCYTAAAHVPPGTTVPLVVERDGKQVRLLVKPRAGL